MKKLFMIALSAMFCVAVNAQLVTSTSYVAKKNKATWYAKVGGTFANFSFDGVEGDDPSSIFGYNIGIAFDSPIGSHGAFWSMGLQLGTKGFKFDDDGEVWKLNANKIEVPITFGYRYHINDDWAVDARLGAFVSYDLWGKFKEEWDGDSDETKIGDVDEYNCLDAGIIFGIGGWYQNLYLQFSYEWGMINQYDLDDYGDDVKGKERNFMISIAYAF